MGRAPYGARGLKCMRRALIDGYSASRPVWGAWIEIATPSTLRQRASVAPRMGRVD